VGDYDIAGVIGSKPEVVEDAVQGNWRPNGRDQVDGESGMYVRHGRHIRSRRSVLCVGGMNESSQTTKKSTLFHSSARTTLFLDLIATDSDFREIAMNAFLTE
jgi:hypothetical protein